MKKTIFKRKKSPLPFRLYNNGGDVVSAGTNLLNTVANDTANKQEIQPATYSPVTSTYRDDLLNEWKNYSGEQANNISVGRGTASGTNTGMAAGAATGIGASAVGVTASTLGITGGLATGAAAGSVVPILGTIVGGLIGAGIGLFGSASKKKRAERRAERMTQSKIADFGAKADTADYSQNLGIMANYAAKGGRLFTNGGNFMNGLTQFNNGGTHESNPNAGVQQGIDGQGVPNLVEEGETKYQDYIFSNRIGMNKNILKSFGLPDKYKDKTIADISKDINKESEERPNDLISKRGMDANLNKLKGIQEALKQASNIQQRGNIFDIGGNTMVDAQRRALEEQRRALKEQRFSLDSSDDDWTTSTPIANRFNKRNNDIINRPNTTSSKTVNNNNTTVKRPNYSTLLPDLKPDYSMPGTKPITTEITDPWGNTTYLDANSKQKNPPVKTKSTTQEQDEKVLPTWMRYAGAAGSGLAALAALASKPDKRLSKGLSGLSVKPQLLSDYMTYKPFDRNFYTNQLAGAAAGTRRSIADISGGNRGSMLAGVMNADYNYGNQLGNLARQAEEYNLSQRRDVATFNRGTNEFNASQKASAQAQNNAYRQSAMLADAQARRENSMARAQHLGNLVESITGIGKENTYKNWINQNPAYSHGYSGNNIAFMNKLGGKLKKKK